MNEVDNPRFTPLDAHHLAFCFLLRDAARSLRLPERTDATAADKTAQALHQARVAFDWTVRQVLLEEKGGDLRPPQFVLPEGRGGSRERALVFLALLHQLGLDGCMIAFPADGSEALNYRLAGVLLLGEGGGIYLFDPKLGVPLPAPDGKGVATLEQFRAPKEQKAIFAQLNLDDTYRYDITPELATKGEVHLVFPLSALSARMRYLEDEVFAAHDRVQLTLQPGKVLERFEAAKAGPVQVWNRRTVKGKPLTVTPTRLLRLYLPAEEGGINQLPFYRFHKENLIPWAPVVAALHELRIYKQLPGEAGEHQVRYFTERLFRKYVRTPWTNLLHGRVDAASKPLFRLQTVLDDQAFVPADEMAFLKEVEAWRQQAKRVFIDRDKPGGRPAYERFWGEDHYLGKLVSPSDSDDELDLKKLSPGMLSKVVVRAAGDRLRRDIVYLQALRWQEKAERAQARSEQLGVRGTKAAEDARNAWVNAEHNWRTHTDLFPFTSATLKARLQTVQLLRQGREPDLGRTVLEHSFHDLRRALTARLWLARALTMWGGKDKEALATLRELERQAATVAAVEELKALRKEVLDEVPNEAQRQQLEAALFGDFQPAGSFFWLRYRAQLELRRLSGRAGL